MSCAPIPPKHLLFLIENSAALSVFWSELRGSFLPKMVEQLSGSHPADLIEISTLESLPAAHQPALAPRQFDSLEAGLQSFSFNFNPENKISTTQIQAGVEFLSSQTVSVARHLIIVAATPPIQFSHSHQDPWEELARALTQEDIYLHLILTMDQRAGRLSSLFEQTLKWQQNIEEPLWLKTYSTTFTFRVSAQQTYSDADLAQKHLESPLGFHSPLASDDLIPPDVYTSKALDDMSPESPSIVSKLQKVHGLTKKKVYGAKPVRLPFCRDEPIRDKYRKAPTPLLPPSAGLAQGPSFSDTHTGRIRPLAKGDRISRRNTDSSYPPRQSQWDQPTPSPEEEFSVRYCPSTIALPELPMAVSSSYPFPANSSGACSSSVPASGWPGSSYARDDLYTRVPLSLSSAPSLPTYNHEAYGYPAESRRAGLPPLSMFPPAQDEMMIATSPPFLLSPLITGHNTHGAAAGTDAMNESPQLEGSPVREGRHDIGEFPFPPTPLRAHPTYAHAPAPPAHDPLPPYPDTHPVFCAPCPSQIMHPIPIPPPISAPVLHEHAENLCNTVTSYSLHAQKARHAASSSPTASSGRTRDGFASSSLTGWAG
ncbi:hypothetical protein C8J57DRAFT_1501614 [Mycena rebaudengoi]|nr:hypothetical protein C8J57DRAFT_1501614 [Mycena rebaudengoi]